MENGEGRRLTGGDIKVHLMLVLESSVKKARAGRFREVGERGMCKQERASECERSLTVRLETK